MQDANGPCADFAYSPRDWLTHRTVRAGEIGTREAGDALTHMVYDAVGNITQVTQPDGDYLVSTDDAARRLIKITDALSNVIDYCPGGVGSATCLDAAGNRLIEQTQNATHAIKRHMARLAVPLPHKGGDPITEPT